MMQLVKSKQRVADHGEVFTAEREVKAMCDLVADECLRAESKFFEPGCGDGNFLAEILTRKLEAVTKAYKRNKYDYERCALTALGSLYAVDILDDNIRACRERLYLLWDDTYRKAVKKKEQSADVRTMAHQILSSNIVCGNALNLHYVGEDGHDTDTQIHFSEWVFASSLTMKRSDYAMENLLMPEADQDEAPGYEQLALDFSAPAVSEEADAASYETVHKEQSGLFCGMRFDVIIGNPPYQMSDGGGRGKSAKPIYQLFVEQARRMNPRYITMIIPSRWFSGGKGLDDFRKMMLRDRRIRKLVDYDNFREVFSGVDLAGGACYFLWDRDHKGSCEVTNISGQNKTTAERYLDEYDIFIRQNAAVKIVEKVLAKAGGHFLNEVVCSRNAFAIPSTYSPKASGMPCFYTQKEGKQFAAVEDVKDPAGILGRWKVLVPKAPIAGQTDFSRPISFYYEGNTRIAAPGECCSESWLVIGAFETEAEALAYKSYVFTKTVRFLLLMTVVSQNTSKKNFRFIPHLGHYEGVYTDEALCRMWEISEEDRAYIDSKISG